MIEIKTVTTGTLLTAICDAEQQESQDEEIINVGQSQEYEVESEFLEDATSEIRYPVPTEHSMDPKRKRR